MLTTAVAKGKGAVTDFFNDKVAVDFYII